MIKQFYIVRHGQTEYNLKRLVQGKGIDADLNGLGQEQASRLYEAYKHISFDKCYTSSLKRTTQTVKHFLEAGLVSEPLSGLDEMGYGFFEGKEIDLHKIDGKTVLDISNEWEAGNFEVKPSGGESLYDVQQREREAFDYILSNEDESVVLVCMHSRAIRILLCTLLDLSFDRMKTFVPKNTGVSILNYDTDTKKFELESFNMADHLNGIKV
ncbi:histidine phosphatase family protein [Limibacter armeniacum]|uniref:histidine phosphatase family protein n=1 Tax=Limibacter armeniacum TaxID=466084 RepID=UPI002FE67570